MQNRTKMLERLHATLDRLVVKRQVTSVVKESVAIGSYMAVTKGKTEGGLHIPDQVEEEGLRCGLVILAGRGRFVEETGLFMPNEIKAGFTVHFPKGVGAEFTFDGELFLIMGAGDVFMFEGEEDKKYSDSEPQYEFGHQDIANPNLGEKDRLKTYDQSDKT